MLPGIEIRACGHTTLIIENRSPDLRVTRESNVTCVNQEKCLAHSRFNPLAGAPWPCHRFLGKSNEFSQLKNVKHHRLKCVVPDEGNLMKFSSIRP